jgi:hypothetical protein
MNKKGQFYIFTAIVLSALLLTMSTTNHPQTSVTSSQFLYDNFLNELPYVINSKIFASENPVTNLDVFFSDFQDYSQYHSTTLTYLYLFKNNSQLFIKNMLNTSATISIKNWTFALPRTENRTLNVSKTIINISDYETEFTFDENKTFEFKALLYFNTFDSIQIREFV